MGRGEVSHGHFLLSCSDGGFLKLVKPEAYQTMHKFLSPKKEPTEQLRGRMNTHLLVIIWAMEQWRWMMGTLFLGPYNKTAR